MGADPRATAALARTENSIRWFLPQKGSQKRVAEPVRNLCSARCTSLQGLPRDKFFAPRADPDLRQVPVIFLSARAGEEARIEGMHAGADDYLIKPFGARELLARVQAHLRLAQLRQEATRSLLYSAAQFETLLSKPPLGVYLVDADFRIRHVNPSALSAFGDIAGGLIPI